MTAQDERAAVVALREVFLPAVLHGDEEHRQWLRDAVEAFIAGEPIPPARGSGRGDHITPGGEHAKDQA